MLRLAVLSLVAVAALVLPGCGKPEDRIVDKWVIDEGSTEEAFEKKVLDDAKAKEKSAGNPVDEAEIRSQVKFVLAMVIGANPVYEIKPDKTFSRQMRGEQEQTGTWRFESPNFYFSAKGSDVAVGEVRSGLLWISEISNGKRTKDDLEIVMKPAP